MLKDVFISGGRRGREFFSYLYAQCPSIAQDKESPMAETNPLKPAHIILIGFLVVLFISVNQYSDIIRPLSDHAGDEALSAILAGKLRIHLVLNCVASAPSARLAPCGAGRHTQRR